MHSATVDDSSAGAGGGITGTLQKGVQQLKQKVAGTNGSAAAPSLHHAEDDRFGTRLIHIGSEPSEETGAVIPAISLSTTFKQSSIGVHKGFEYTRSLNPTRLAFEKLLASLEGGFVHPTGADPLSEDSLPGALAFASGSAVTSTIVQGFVPAGGHIVSVSDVYGGTYRYLTKVAPGAQGVDTTFVDMAVSSVSGSEEEANKELERKIEAAFRENTKIVWVETPTNPTLRLVDIALVSRIAHRHSALLIVDNTFLTPYYQRPLSLGADIVIHSITKYINGHSDVLGGVAISRDPALVNRLRFIQNAFGAVPSAFDSWLALRGAKTLELRMRQHGLSALKIARWLDDEGKKRGLVREVIYAGTGTGYGEENRERVRKLAWRQIPESTKEWIREQGFDGETGDFPYGGMLSFRVAGRGGGEAADSGDLGKAAEEFLKGMRLFTLAESLGGVESLAEVPARMTHASVSEDDRRTLGIDDGLVRLSVGIEDTRDLINDIAQALEKAVAARG